MSPESLIQHLIERRKLFLHFRWLLFLWLGATALVREQAGGSLTPAFGILAAMLASQIALWKAPLKYLEGLKIFYAIFLFDLLMILLGLRAVGALQRDLVVTLFLGTFMAALTKNVRASALSTLILAGIYVSMKLAAPDGFDASQAAQLLNLPFLLIASVHSGLVAQEADNEHATLDLLAQSHHQMARNLANTFSEASRFNRDISALLNSMPFGLIMLDAKGVVSFFNQMSEFMFGARSENVVGFGLRRHEPLGSVAEALIKAEAPSEVNFQYFNIPSHEGSPVPATLSTYPVDGPEGEAVGTLILVMPLPYQSSVAHYFEALQVSGEVDERHGELARVA